MRTGREVMVRSLATWHAVRVLSPVIMTTLCEDSMSRLTTTSDSGLSTELNTTKPPKTSSDSMSSRTSLVTSCELSAGRAL